MTRREQYLQLAEAMMLGCTLTKQSMTCYWTFIPGGMNEKPEHVVESCALGAAGVALGKEFEQLLEHFSILQTDFVSCSELDNNYRSLHIAIIQLNDIYKWTRERIADWVASIAPEEELKEVKEEELVVV